jgi:carbonic anhydrase
MQKTYLALISFGCIAQDFVQAAGSAVVDYKTNGANWGDDYPLCKYGKEQTPINLTTRGYSTSPNMQLNGYAYQNMPRANVTRSANSINLNLSAGEFEIAFPDGSKSLFSPLQFHFHAPSEHSVDGKLYDLELHIVHTYKDSPTSLGAVIGIFFDREKGGNYANPFLDSLAFGSTVLDTAVPVTNVNLANLLSSADFSRYWSYKGSLTTPPCTEGIKWSVLE